MRKRIAFGSILTILGAATTWSACSGSVEADPPEPCAEAACGGTGASGSDATGSGEGDAAELGARRAGASGGACKYVDLLFVIDNSASMSKYQADLAAAFPGFTNAMFERLPKGVDLHVGITTTSFFSGSCSEGTSNCRSTATKADVEAHYTPPTEGTTSKNGEQGRLFVHDGLKYFATNTSSPDPALATWFAGAATAAGEMGCSYEVASAAAAYVTHPANAPTNSGFLRDEGGVLVVFVLSDEPDKSPESVATYVDMLTSAKQRCGGARCILTAALLDPCVRNFGDTVWQFLSSFGAPPIWGDLEDPTMYSAVVGDTLAQVVGQKCDEIAVPE